MNMEKWQPGRLLQNQFIQAIHENVWHNNSHLFPKKKNNNNYQLMIVTNQQYITPLVLWDGIIHSWNLKTVFSIWVDPPFFLRCYQVFSTWKWCVTEEHTHTRPPYNVSHSLTEFDCDYVITEHVFADAISGNIMSARSLYATNTCVFCEQMTLT